MENTIHLAILGVFRIVENTECFTLGDELHLASLSSEIKSEKLWTAEKQDQIHFSIRFFFSQIPLELHISMAVFINFGWTKNFDRRPQTLCHPSGPSCQSVQ